MIDEPLVVVSNDTHIGPRLVEDLRAYCPSAFLDEFDRFTESTAADRAAATAMLQGSGYLDHPNFRTAGHHDSAARLADYDHDGIAAGVLFHGSMNLEPLPFVESPLGKPKRDPDREVLAVGQQMYNRWLADFVAQAPHRHIGLAHLPLWDVDAAIAELQWARDVGLRGVNFPAMRDGELPEYNRRSWEPFWAACAELGMPLVTHVGGGTNARYTGLESVALMQLESAGFLSQRGVVDDPRRRVRAAPRPEARHHGDARQLVPPEGRRARRALRLLRLEACRAPQPGAARASAEAAE